MKRTIVTIETWQKTVVRRRFRGASCPRCGAESSLLMPDEAVALPRTTAGEIFRRVEVGKLHYMETDAGALLVCQSQLVDKTSGGETNAD
jgi:hypothetical protein